MRFTIMQRTPGYRVDGSTTEEAITGREGTLLRILILHQGHPLSKEEIASYLTRSGRHSVLPSSVPGYIARLRNKVAPNYIRSLDGYSAVIDRSDVDALVFEDLINQYGVCEISDVDDMDSEWSDRYEQLLDLYAMWRANPALTFADDEEGESLATIYHDFERYWDCLRRCIIYSELKSSRKPRIEKAISRIDQLLRWDPDDEQAWALLFRAQASLPGRDYAVASVLTRIRQQFNESIPRELNYIINRITSGHDDALFAIESGRRSNEDQQRVDQLVQTIGISPASELELRQSKLEPLECIRQTVGRLRFAGILATKWVADSYVRAEFARLLERLDNSDGSVQFLLIDPEAESYRRFMQVRWSSGGGTQPIDILHSLSAEHPCFQVRLYDSLPTFRIVLIDQSIVSFSPYLMNPVTGMARTGWLAPHVVLDRTAPWPLARTFETLFDETWRTANPLFPSAGNA